MMKTACGSGPMPLRPPMYFSRRSRSFSSCDDFLLRELLVGAVFLHALERAQAIEAVLDGAEVRERAAEPAVGDEVHAGATRLFLHDVLRLALGADEEHVAAAADRLDDEVERALEEARGLVEVDDVDAVARAVDERAHLRVPALRLVAEVDARFEERANAQRFVRIAQGALHLTGSGDLGGRFWDCGIGDAGRRFVHVRFSFRLNPPPRRGQARDRSLEHRTRRTRFGACGVFPTDKPAGAGNLRQEPVLVKARKFQRD